jgi:AraC-like DNA-binding protein
MSGVHNPSAGSGSATGPEARFGFLRRVALATGPAGTVGNLFADLRRLTRGELIAENPERHLQGTRLPIDRRQGHGSWELYRLADELYMAVADGLYDTALVEKVPGEGFIEFHLRLAGALELTLPGVAAPVTVSSSQLLTLYQPPGVDVLERVIPGGRDSAVSLYCRPRFLAALARDSGVERWELLEEIGAHRSTSAWYRQTELSSTLMYVGKSLLDSPYRRGIRLLHAEAKALEVLCEVLAAAQVRERFGCEPTNSDAGRLDLARRQLATHLGEPTRLDDIARRAGMCKSKLTRVFKERFGITVSDYRLQCRMRHALELLRCKRMSVTEVAFAVGYRHATSFAAAFQAFFGFSPRQARTEMH